MWFAQRKFPSRAFQVPSARNPLPDSEGTADWVLFVLSGTPPEDLKAQTRQRLEAVIIVLCVVATAAFAYLLLVAIQPERSSVRRRWSAFWAESC
jgi:hypothetical protein